MDRRTFVKGSLSGLLAYNCSFARGRAATTLHGCRLAANADEPPEVRLLEQNEIPQAKLDDLSRAARQVGSSLSLWLRPGIGFYDDSSDGPNARADPGGVISGGNIKPVFTGHCPADCPDGTVLMGINLFDQIVPADLPKREFHFFDHFVLRSIVAHEFGHILQFKLGMNPAGPWPWQMEPHADFLAGWSLGREAWTVNAAQVEEVVKAFFDHGDRGFRDHPSHGQPSFRAAMVRAGYELGRRSWIRLQHDSRALLDFNYDLRQAFEEGKKAAGLT